MNAILANPPIPAARVALLLRYTDHLQTVGAPLERLMAQAGIPSELLDHPAAAVPLKSAFRFGELACRALGTEHLGLHVGLETSFEDLGPYGQTLQGALTLGDYLRKGIALYDRLITGQRFWLSRHGQELRLNLASPGEPELGSYQSHLESLVVSIANIRRAAGPGWSPREISLAYKAKEDLPDIEHLSGARVLRGTGETYLTIPSGMLGRRFAGRRGATEANAASPLIQPLPTNLADMVQLQIGCLLAGRACQLDTVAESLAMSGRSLQRALAQAGVSYSQILTEVRMHRAADWLDNTDKPVAEIAFDLGYTDTSNFTRAFRRQLGVAPQAFREATGETLQGKR
jgi:AraC-like DNA-binding protein